MFSDTHSHLFFENFNDDLDLVINRAFEQNVNLIIIPGTDIKTSERAVEIAESYDNIYATAGVHPHDTKDWSGSEIEILRGIARNKKVVAIGEIGLDYYYDFSPKDQQILAFRQQLDLAIELGLPVIIHNRDANEDVMEIIREYFPKGLKGQFHCFAGTAADAKELVQMGFCISAPGNVTFKSMDNLRNIIREVPVENLLLETDAPFMTPVPHRGKRNEPAYIPLVAAKIAELHNISIEEVGNITSANAIKLFGLNSK